MYKPKRHSSSIKWLLKQSELIYLLIGVL